MSVPLTIEREGVYDALVELDRVLRKRSFSEITIRRKNGMFSITVFEERGYE